MIRPPRAAAALVAWAFVASAQQRNPSPARTEMQKAVDEFRTQSRNLGLRADSPARRDSRQRSGSWHGRLFENLRNNFLDAVPHEIVQRGGTQGLLRRNQFGFNVTGPVYVPKLFHGGRNTTFSVTYEGMREKVARSQLRTIPTMGERTGDWAHVVDQAGQPLSIYDPATTSPNPAYGPGQPVTRNNLQYNRLPFPGNRIPTARLNPVAKDTMQYYPAPNADAGPFFRNNYFIVAPEVNRADGIIARVDHTASDRHRLGCGINYSNGHDGQAPYFPTIANSGSVPRDRRSRRLTAEHVFTQSARNINTLTLDASTDQSENRPSLDSTGQPFPFYRFNSTYLGMGQSYPLSRNARNTYTATDSFSSRWKEHRLRAIVQLTREQINTFWPQYPNGAFRFGAGYTSLPGIVNTGHPFASFLLGAPETVEQSIVISPSYFRRSRGLVGLRDQVDLRPGLTLSLGLNFDGATPRVERYDRQSTVAFDRTNPFNGRPGAMIVAGHEGTPRAFQPLQLTAEPSASIAWNILGRTRSVARAGYSRSYTPTPVYLGQWGTQAFNGSPTWVSLNPQLDPAFVLSGSFPPLPRPFPDPRPESANFTTADLIEPTGRQPTYQSASLSAEHELPGAAVVTVGFGHSEGRNMFLSNSGSNPNAIHLDNLALRDRLNDENFNRSLRPFPHYQRFDVYSSWPEGRYQRDAGYVRLEKRASGGLSVSAYYEFSKQMDNYSGPYGIQDFFNRRNEWSLTASNTPHRFTLTYMYELPLGANRALLTVTDWRRHFVEGWSLSGQSTVASGEPVALRPQFNNTGGLVDALNVNAVPGVDPHVPDPGPNQWFNPAAFSHPSDFSVGNAARTHPSLRMPINQNHDLSVNKRIPLTPERSVEFSAVGLNFINHADWTEPDTVIGPPNAPNVNAGKIIGSRGSRVVQLGVRFNF
ncbi:MAG: TonB-dependent receptor [Acidobacteria bacterium]|nr:TonB-dependent receptor [Acidobacteriota bacterium]